MNHSRRSFYTDPNTHVMLDNTHVMLDNTHVMLDNTHFMLDNTHVMLDNSRCTRSSKNKIMLNIPDILLGNFNTFWRNPRHPQTVYI